jgi:excisionase family DNA binding protein
MGGLGAAAMLSNIQVVNRTSNMPNLHEFVTTEEAAEMLGFNSKSIRNMVYNGKIEYTRFGRSLLISRKSLKEYIERTKGMSKNDPRRGNN